MNLRECHNCGNEISFYRKFGIEAWRHGLNGSEFCSVGDNSIKRASPYGEEER